MAQMPRGMGGGYSSALASSQNRAPDGRGGKAGFNDYNTSLVKCLHDLREKREHISRQINAEEREKQQVQQELAALTEKLHRLAESIQSKIKAKSEYDRTIAETESAYMKIVESSQTLLHVLRRESQNLDQR